MMTSHHLPPPLSHHHLSPVSLPSLPNWSLILTSCSLFFAQQLKWSFPKQIRRCHSSAHNPTLILHFTHNRIKNLYRGFQTLCEQLLWSALVLPATYLWFFPWALHRDHPGAPPVWVQPSTHPTRGLCARSPSLKWSSASYLQLFSLCLSESLLKYQHIRSATAPFPCFLCLHCTHDPTYITARLCIVAGLVFFSPHPSHLTVSITTTLLMVVCLFVCCFTVLSLEQSGTWQAFNKYFWLNELNEWTSCFGRETFAAAE